MHIACLDFEGVLVPEIWVGLAERTGIAELRAEAYRISRFLPTTDAILAIADREHAEIVRAITAKKPARARSLMEAHVRGTARLQAGLGKITHDPHSS